MEEKWINQASIIGKEMLNLADGTFIGKIQDVMVDGEGKCVVGLLLKNKSILSGKNMVPYSAVRAFGAHAVTVDSLDNQTAQTGRDLTAMPVVTVDGTILGKVFDYAFNPEDGQITELLLANSLLKGAFADKGSLSGDKVMRIGKEVIIAAEGVTEKDLTQPEEGVYGTWQEIDDILEGLNEDEVFEEIKEEDWEESCEEQLDEITNRINKTIEDVANRIKEVDTDELADKFKEQAGRFSEEARGLFTLMKDRLQNGKNAAKEGEAENITRKLAEDLQNKTVSKPLLDSQGNVILWPGQMIGENEISEAIKAGKLQQLLDLAAPLEESTPAEEILAEDEAGNPDNDVENSLSADKE